MHKYETVAFFFNVRIYTINFQYFSLYFFNPKQSIQWSETKKANGKGALYTAKDMPDFVYSFIKFSFFSQAREQL